MKHLLDNANSSDSEATPPVKKAKLEAIEATLDEFGPIKDVSFEPFECETSQPAKATLPPDFPTTAKPYDYFTLFFTPALLARQWRELLMEELFVFIGVLVYMGIHEEPRIDMYWNTDKKRGLIHTISAYIALNRYKEIKRYYHISDPENDERLGRYLPTNTVWWYKVEPLALEIQASCQRYYSLSSEVSIDELMVRCFGRSSYTYKMPILKTRYANALAWNTLIAKVVENTFCLAWQDNNIVLAFTKIRKRPAKTLTNGRIVRQIFGEDYTKELYIPRFIDDYNYYIGGVDLANQFREAYETHRTTQRNWLYLLYTNTKRLLNHLQFKTKLYCTLLAYSTKVQLTQLYAELGGKRLFNPDLQYIHFWGKLPKRNSCKVLGNLIQKPPKKSYGGCIFCTIAL
ncbi:hypothetical protein DL98DRAFT_523135, partial [Cadophora sp. DSE1049]